LALVCGYEEIFIRLKGENKEKRKMKWKIIKFSNLNLAKLSALRRNLVNVIFCSLTASELKENLLKFQNILNMKVGENYMKRAKFYKVCSAIGIIIFSLGLYLVNSNFNISLLVELVKSLWISNIKSVLSLIFSLGLIFALFALFWSLGNEKKKYEELNYVKKFALSKLLIAIQRQKKLITEYIDLENRNELFYQYIVPICEISVEATKVIASYENLLSSWEKEMLSQLEFSAIRCINDFDINADELVKLNADEFEELFNNKKRTAPQKDDFNYFLSELKSDLEKYKEKHAEAIIEFHGLFE
ncbi:MAG: hypothetical protein LBL34_00285, partial [Clostridiales bacterium]|nr:hypothetical protein [Clostridiales bacterium]